MSKKHVESSVFNNMRSTSVRLKRSLSLNKCRVTSMAVFNNLIFLGFTDNCCKLFRYENSQLEEVLQFSTSEIAVSDCQKPGSCGVYEMHAFGNYLFYMKEESTSCTVCLHRMSDILEGEYVPVASQQLCRKAPVVIEPSLGLVVICGAAWSAMSWGDPSASQNLQKQMDDSWVCALSLPHLEELHAWKAVTNAVLQLRIQLRNSESLLGIADTRTGLRVYDLLHKKSGSKDYSILYEVPAEEIRTFEIVGEFVAIFHKFEANVSLWHMRQQRTILCINIQDQMRELTFTEQDDDDDCGLCRDEDDSVTTATSVALDGDHLLLYGTRSGSLSGMSVGNRCKLFALPCSTDKQDVNVEGDSADAKLERNEVQFISFMQPGAVVVCYEKGGLSILDFSD